MAQFIGIAGEFQRERAISRRLNALMALFVGCLLVMFALGYVTGRHRLWPAIIAIVSIVPAIRMLERLFDKQLRLARLDETGVAGEMEIVPYLKDLPDSYTVVCDLDFADSYGNIDHLVIGPTGIFAIDVKNWRGTVTSDDKGELLQNGEPTSKPHVRYFTRRVMELKDRLKALTKLDPYVQAVFVFPRTHIQAKWGTTGAVHCIHAEQLVSYVLDYKSANQIAAHDVSRIAGAVKALKESAPKKPQRPERE